MRDTAAEDGPVTAAGANDAAEPASVPTRSPEAIIEILTGFPDDLGRVIDGQPKETLLRPTEDGGWGVVEIIPHLRDWEEVLLERLRLMSDQERPQLPAPDDELWAIERDYRGQDPAKTLGHFRELREQLVTLLRELPPEGWQRTGMHAEQGEITIHWLADQICAHDAEHIQQAREAIG